MRLPSTSYDKNDIVQDMCDGGDLSKVVVEAEEYLQPTTAPNHDNNNLDAKVVVISIDADI